MKILVIPDLHFPFEHRGACRILWKRICQVKFTHIVQVGDLLDQYSYTRFAKKNIYLPERELKDGREKAADMWAKIRAEQPQAACIQILGNHDVRAIKRAQESLPAAQELVRDSLLELYEFEGVHLVRDPREEFIINDIAFLHGYRTKLGDHTKFMHMNTVHGHTHRGGVAFIPMNDKILWELDAGYLADKNKEPIAYTPQRTSNWTLGWGEIDNFGPRFCPIDLTVTPRETQVLELGPSRIGEE